MDPTTPGGSSSRINVDTLSDWTHIQENFGEAVRVVLEANVDENTSAADRQALLAHLEDWQRRTFEMLKPNVRANGHNLEDAIEEEEMEPFDEPLDVSIYSMADERYTWDKTLATHRREEPKRLESIMVDMLERQREAMFQPIAEDEEDELLKVPEATDVLSGIEEMKKIHASTVQQALNAQTTAPALVAKAERMARVLDEIGRLPP